MPRYLLLEILNSESYQNRFYNSTERRKYNVIAVYLL